MSRVAVFGAGYVGLVTGACFADLGHEVVIRDILADRIDGAPPRPGSDLRAGSRRAARAKRRAAPLHDRRRRGGRRMPTSSTSPSARRPPTRGRRPLCRLDGDRRAAAGRPARDRRHEEHRSGRHGREDPPAAGRARARPRGLRLESRSSPPRARRARLHAPDRTVIGAFEDVDADAVAELHRGIDAPIVRCDVASAEMIKLAANAFLTTRISFINEIANVCELVGADVNEVAHGVGLDHRLGPHFLRGRRRVRRLLLPEGHHCAEAARRELRVPLPAPERRDRGQRAAEATRDREASAAPRPPPGQDGRAARARLQAAHGRHAGGAELRARRVGCSPRAPTSAPGTRSRRPTASTVSSRSPPSRRRSPASTPPCS